MIDKYMYVDVPRKRLAHVRDHSKPKMTISFRSSTTFELVEFLNQLSSDILLD